MKKVLQQATSVMHQSANYICDTVPWKAISMEFSIHLYKYKDVVVSADNTRTSVEDTVESYVGRNSKRFYLFVSG